jgi:hypothetical protein
MRTIRPSEPRRSPQRSRSAEREATSRGGGAPRHYLKSEGSERGEEPSEPYLMIGFSQLGPLVP